jgi:hypothetical protein
LWRPCSPSLCILSMTFQLFNKCIWMDITKTCYKVCASGGHCNYVLNTDACVVNNIVGLGIIDQRYALIITPLFITHAPTCYGIHMPSSGSVLYPYNLLERQNGYVVVMYCKRWWLSAQLDNITHETTTTSAHRPPTFTVHDYNITILPFK